MSSWNPSSSIFVSVENRNDGSHKRRRRTLVDEPLNSDKKYRHEKQHSQERDLKWTQHITITMKLTTLTNGNLLASILNDNVHHLQQHSLEEEEANGTDAISVSMKLTTTKNGNLLASILHDNRYRQEQDPQEEEDDEKETDKISVSMRLTRMNNGILSASILGGWDDDDYDDDADSTLSLTTRHHSKVGFDIKKDDFPSPNTYQDRSTIIRFKMSTAGPNGNLVVATIIRSNTSETTTTSIAPFRSVTSRPKPKSILRNRSCSTVEPIIRKKLASESSRAVSGVNTQNSISIKDSPQGSPLPQRTLFIDDEFQRDTPTITHADVTKRALQIFPNFRDEILQLVGLLAMMCLCFRKGKKAPLTVFSSIGFT